VPLKRITLLPVVLALLALVAWAAPASAAPGDPDLTFGTAGEFSLALSAKGSEGDSLRDSATDAAGRTILVGASQDDKIGFDRWSILAVGPDGKLDRSFGDHGKIFPKFHVHKYPRQDEDAIGVAIRPDGKILVAGIVNDSTLKDYRRFDPEYVSVDRIRFAVMQFLPNGHIDRSFGKRGLAKIKQLSPSAQPESQVELTGMALSTSGRVVLYGQNDERETVAYAINTKGRLDKSFGTAGHRMIWRTLKLPFGDLTPGSAAPTPDGGIIFAGSTFSCQKKNYDICRKYWKFAKVDAAGKLDASFGAGGRATVSWAESKFSGFYTGDPPRIDVAPDGRILATGDVMSAATENGIRGGVVRLGSNGALDAGFGANGVAYVPLAASGDSISGSSTVLADTSGATFVVGQSCPGSVNGEFGRSAIVCEYDAPVHNFTLKLNSDGSADPTWGHGGLSAYVDATLGNYVATSISADSKRILLALNTPTKQKSETNAFGLIAQQR
jgi:uncharacterized delta-60 repeat protein